MCTGGATAPEAASPAETARSVKPPRERGTPESYDSEDLPLKKPCRQVPLAPWLHHRDRDEQQLALDHLLRKDGIYDPKREKIMTHFRARVASKVKVATGSGEKEGSKFHCVEIDLINTFAARSLFWDLPRTGPTKRGRVKSYNWEVKASEIHLLAKLLSFEENPTTFGKGWDNGIIRRRGDIMVAVIPPVLVEHKETRETETLVFSFYTAEMNNRGVISWPPATIYNDEIEYKKVEIYMWRLMYRMWINLPHEAAWHTMSWRFRRLAWRAYKGGLTCTDDEMMSDESAPEDEWSAEEEEEEEEPEVTEQGQTQGETSTAPAPRPAVRPAVMSSPTI